MFLAHFPVAGRLLRDPKLSLQAPSVMAADASMFDGLDAMEKLRLIENWRPTKPEDFVDVKQTDLQVDKAYMFI